MTQVDITEFGTDDVSEDMQSDEEDTGETFAAVVTVATWGELADSLRQVLAATRVVAGSGLGAAERDKFVRRVVNREVGLVAPVGEENTGYVGAGESPSDADLDSAIDFIVGHDIPHFFVDTFDTLGASHGAIADRVRELVADGVEVHVVAQGFDIDSENCESVLGVLDGLDAAGLELQRRADVRDIQHWLPETDRAGRPALGFEKIDGELTRGENFDEVRAVVSMRLSEDITKQKAADRLGVSPRTITRAEENAGRYGLEEEGEDTEA
ncbi:helix-turn-helix domain-containing protein [Halorussus aquaticus]|uniref:Helix-turn-helix domain-containing protein n=1 Tax=Halorussus aquaticus TaxID=2953748 RepID=A0ABD5Q307_9EURY|nr:helix-turn-helix domain-containing protein [Halorussus aquaticus]